MLILASYLILAYIFYKERGNGLNSELYGYAVLMVIIVFVFELAYFIQKIDFLFNLNKFYSHDYYLSLFYYMISSNFFLVYISLPGLILFLSYFVVINLELVKHRVYEAKVSLRERFYKWVIPIIMIPVTTMLIGFYTSFSYYMEYYYLTVKTGAASLFISFLLIITFSIIIIYLRLSQDYIRTELRAMRIKQLVKISILIIIISILLTIITTIPLNRFYFYSLLAVTILTVIVLANAYYGMALYKDVRASSISPCEYTPITEEARQQLDKIERAFRAVAGLLLGLPFLYLSINLLPYSYILHVQGLSSSLIVSGVLLFTTSLVLSYDIYLLIAGQQQINLQYPMISTLYKFILECILESAQRVVEKAANVEELYPYIIPELNEKIKNELKKVFSEEY